MTRALLALVVLALALPATAQGQTPKTNAPPGNSAIDEYLETVPGATGNTRPRQPAQDGSAGDDAVLTAAERARLERHGPDGKILADAVDSTAPAAATPTAERQPRSTEAKPELRSTEAEGSPGRGLVDAVAGGDGGGMGLALPAILVAALLAAITAVLLRRRSTS